MIFGRQLVSQYEAATGKKYDPQPPREQAEIPHRFYCKWPLLPGDSKQYRDGKELIEDPHGLCCFNCFIGLPTRKWEEDIGKEPIPVPLTNFNYRMIKNYFKHKKYSQNKCRGSGASEILTIRYMIYKYGVLPNTKNRKCIIMPGTSSKLSTEFSLRIKEICDRIPWIYANQNKKVLKPMDFDFATGGRILLTSATPDASRGFENVGDIVQEEVAHWELIDDKPVYYSSEGVHEKTQCHIIHNTTPRGKRGFYYDLVWSPDATSTYYKHITNWREVIGLPVRTIEELMELGHISEKKFKQLRKQCLHTYAHDESYKEWYDSFFVDNGQVIPIKEILDVSIPILDVNAIVNDALTDRSHFDQELDNQFISTENRAIGQFAEVDLKPDDLEAQIKKYDQSLLQGKEFNPSDYE